MPALPLSRILVLVLALAAYASADISFTPKVKCANYPQKVAGTLIPARSLAPAVFPRSSGPIYWCAPSTETYIGLQPAHPITGPAVANMLAAASANISTHIHDAGDGEIGGGWDFSGENTGLPVRMRTYDAGGHHMTWGVLGAAMQALGNWVAANGGTAGYFDVFDGKNQVGAGFLG